VQHVPGSGEVAPAPIGIHTSIRSRYPRRFVSRICRPYRQAKRRTGQSLRPRR
jgi:hypothetical protein